MLGIIAGPVGAQGHSDSDTGPGADPAGRGRRRPRTGPLGPEPGDSDFARPMPQGDTFQSDRAPGPRTGLTDRDVGPSGDQVGHGTGGNRQVRIARCQGLRQRIARYEAVRPRTPDIDARLTALQRHLGGMCRG